MIQGISRKVVERCHAIPFGMDDKLLQVAMIDPKNMSALDEIAAFTGCKVAPWVAPEARIFQAMERYYTAPRLRIETRADLRNRRTTSASNRSTIWPAC